MACQMLAGGATLLMLKKMLSALRAKPAPQPAPVVAPIAEETAIFESLAMTDELREALFPKSPQMISAIFDRPAPLQRPAFVASSSPAPSRDSLFM